jgi:hypothetical protein
VSCAKPISIPDRWDDVTPTPGYDGSAPKRPHWDHNGQLDSESFTDANGNGLWDVGEPFTDSNGNGIYDHEIYDPLTTGYRAGPSPLSPSGDAGASIALAPNNASISTAGMYYSIDYPPENRGTPITGGDEYRNLWSTCNPGLVGAGDRCQPEPGNMVGPTNQAMRDLIAQDPDAYWDPTTLTVQGSAFSQSPRVILFPVHDPRIPLTGSAPRLIITKVVALFMEQMIGSAMVQGRFIRALGSGQSCGVPGDGFVVECPTAATPTSWGRIKGTYR